MEVKRDQYFKIFFCFTSCDNFSSNQQILAQLLQHNMIIKLLFDCYGLSDFLFHANCYELFVGMGNSKLPKTISTILPRSYQKNEKRFTIQVTTSRFLLWKTLFIYSFIQSFINSFLREMQGCWKESTKGGNFQAQSISRWKREGQDQMHTSIYFVFQTFSEMLEFYRNDTLV